MNEYQLPYTQISLEEEYETNRRTVFFGSQSKKLRQSLGELRRVVLNRIPARSIYEVLIHANPGRDDSFISERVKSCLVFDIPPGNQISIMELDVKAGDEEVSVTHEDFYYKGVIDNNGNKIKVPITKGQQIILLNPGERISITAKAKTSTYEKSKAPQFRVVTNNVTFSESIRDGTMGIEFYFEVLDPRVDGNKIMQIAEDILISKGITLPPYEVYIE